MLANSLPPLASSCHWAWQESTKERLLHYIVAKNAASGKPCGMTCQPAANVDDLSNLRELHGWVTSGRVETPEIVAFRSAAQSRPVLILRSRTDLEPRALAPGTMDRWRGVLPFNARP